MVVSISVVIPVYNEAENIQPLYTELEKVLSPIGKTFEILFVDDGSIDSTYHILTALHEKDKTVRIIKFRKNFGKSAAMKAGFDYANGRIIITMDGDLQNDPHDIPRLLKKMQDDDLDVVCGWRYQRHDPFIKRIVSELSNRFRNILTKEKIHDSGCALKVYKKECTEDLELYGDLHRYIPAILFWKGYHVGEIKVNHRTRNFGQSKYNWTRFSKGFLDLLLITFWQKYFVRPMHFFGGMGLAIWTCGLLIMVYTGIMRFFLGIPFPEPSLFFIGLILLILGVQFIAIGILADILLKIYYRQNSRKNYLIEKLVE
jgi:glycosyltransferase involved in cell wall biosynthesis